MLCVKYVNFVPRTGSSSAFKGDFLYDALQVMEIKLFQAALSLYFSNTKMTLDWIRCWMR